MDGIVSHQIFKKSSFVEAMQDYIQKREKLNKTQVEKIAATFGITDKNDVKEFTELAIVNEARKIALSDVDVYTRYLQIVDLYKHQVNLSHRTSQSVLLQQYSTPAPIGFLAGEWMKANSEMEGYLFEPCAGNGLLTIAFQPQMCYVNEIDETRRYNLNTQGFQRVTDADATNRFGIYRKFFPYVITNPPFGKFGEKVDFDGFEIDTLEHIMAIRALDCMIDNGRAAIIIGGHTRFDEYGRIQAGKNRIFFNYLYKHYNVDDVVQIDGDLYSRQGTSFDVRLILISGRKVTPEGVAPLYNPASDYVIRTFDDLYNRILGNTDMKTIEMEALALKLKLDLLNLDGLGMAYQPKSKGKSLQVDIPDSMGFEMQDALNAMHLKVGDVDQYVTRKLKYKNVDEMHNAIAAEQIDAVALAIYNIEQKGQGVIIGDQTGIGKGRQAAAMIRYGWAQGMQPIFCTEKPNLFSDLYRDLKAIGSETLVPFIVNGKEAKTLVKDEDGNVVYEPLEKSDQDKIIKSAQLPGTFNYVMLTYSQISGSEFSKSGALTALSPKANFVRQIANGNILILDEAHNASGESNTGRVLQNIVEVTKGVTFLSATFAKRPDNMPLYAMKTAMKEANMTKDELVTAISKGGVALQEVLSSQLVKAGQLIRRERTFEGIEVNYLTLDDLAVEHKAIYDNLTDIIRDIINYQLKYINPEVEALDKIASAEGKEIEKRAGTKAAGVDNSPYFSKAFQIVNQMLFAIKADAVTDRAIMRLKQGKKPVIAFSSTMGSFLESMEDEKGMPVAEGSIINADFSASLMKGLDGILRYTEITPEGKSIKKKFDLSMFSVEAQSEYSRIADKINKLSSGIVISPIDVIKQKLAKHGYTVAEVTGRKMEIEFLPTKGKTLGKVSAESAFIKAIVKNRKKENTNDAFRKFNNNEVDVLMINQSGSTGASAHAIPTSKVPKEKVGQRVMILLQAELDINTEVQKRGRINRTGQILKPIYDYVFSAIPAEKRLMMMLQKKLKSLDANTTSNQKNSEALLKSDDFLNKYGDKIVKDYCIENPDFNLAIDDPLKLLDKDSGNESNEGYENAASRVSGRVAVLSTQEQEQFYNEILNRYNDYVDELKQIGEYDLEVEYLDLNAQQLEKTLIKGGKGGETAFGDNTYLERTEVNNLKKPFKSIELKNILLDELKGRKPDEVNAAYISILEEHTARKLAEELSDINEKYTNLIAAVKSGTGKIKKDFTPEEQIQAYEDARNEAIQKANENSANKLRTIKRSFQFFTIGKALKYPSDVLSDAGKDSFCVFLGFKLDMKARNPFAPSNIKANFAIASPLKHLSIPLSKYEKINAIIGASNTADDIDNIDDLLAKWEVEIKNNSGDRTIAYILTGNILQVFGTEAFRGAKLVQYTCTDGKMRKGALLPFTWVPTDVRGNKTIKVEIPIWKARKAVKAMSIGANLFGGNVTLIRKNGYYLVLVPRSRKSGGDIYLDKDLIALTNEKNFNTISSNMEARVNDDNIDSFLKILQDRHSISVELRDWQLELIQNEIEENKANDEIIEVTQLPKHEDIIDEELEILEMEAVALKLKLELLNIAA